MRIGPSGDAKIPKPTTRLRRSARRESSRARASVASSSASGARRSGHEPLDRAVLPELVPARRAARHVRLDRQRGRGRRLPAGERHQIGLDRTARRMGRTHGTVSVSMAPELVQPPTDLPEGLEDVGAGALLRALEARADLRVVELVHLPHGERQPLLLGSAATTASTGRGLAPSTRPSGPTESAVRPSRSPPPRRPAAGAPSPEVIPAEVGGGMVNSHARTFASGGSARYARNARIKVSCERSSASLPRAVIRTT